MPSICPPFLGPNPVSFLVSGTSELLYHRSTWVHLAPIENSTNTYCCYTKRTQLKALQIRHIDCDLFWRNFFGGGRSMRVPPKGGNGQKPLAKTTLAPASSDATNCVLWHVLKLSIVLKWIWTNKKWRWNIELSCAAQCVLRFLDLDEP